MRTIIMAIAVLGGFVWWSNVASRNEAESSGSPDRADADRAGGEPDGGLEALAEQSFFRGEYARAAELYRGVVAGQPDLGLAWARLAYATHELGQYEAALPLHERAAGFDENRGTSRYKIACALARLGRGGEALDALEQAVREGYRDRAWAEREPDLDAVRADPRFDRILNRMAPPPAGRGPLDYWPGFWVVREAERGRSLGHATIQRVGGGHLFIEQWNLFSGETGRGMAYLDPSDDSWHLTRVDSEGRVQRLKGTFSGGTLDLRGELVLLDGRVRPLELTMELRDDGRVVQSSRVSDDGSGGVARSDRLLTRDELIGPGRGHR